MSLADRRYTLVDRATMKCCSKYLCGDNKGKPCVYQFRELDAVKRVLWDLHKIEAIEREIGGEM